MDLSLEECSNRTCDIKNLPLLPGWAPSLRMMKDGHDHHCLTASETVQEALCTGRYKVPARISGKFIQSGLWTYSRHPNYLGEILQWSGLFLSACSLMRGAQHLSVVSPFFLWFLLRHVSSIPILEQQTLKKWGSDPAFPNYIKRHSPTLALSQVQVVHHTPFMGVE
ncbi:hypothetical protein AAFF_G00142990 [Aldrovandia affinis]|uniref:Steroid 5-alpha reductase C-terminal domain-containing protein n=1 Tax=Aldrovandia affinis TaxID=143900 RepID=A0AAD7WWR4_9TELE|nr:hypothetical protein AAFF_G00142990 [Aldrovandia affinis]